MSTEETKETARGLSRRQFLKDAGLMVGGAAAVGSIGLASACGNKSAAVGAPITVTVTQPPITKVSETLPAGVITLNVNGKSITTKVQPNWTLLYVLREKLGLTGTKRGCDEGSCGACTLIMDNRPVLSCMILAIEVKNAKIQTIEGLATTDLHPVQAAFVKYDGMQCGFCAPGQIMAAKALLDFNPKPTADLVKESLGGNLCRCGSYANIVSAVLSAAGG